MLRDNKASTGWMSGNRKVGATQCWAKQGKAGTLGGEQGVARTPRGKWVETGTPGCRQNESRTLGDRQSRAILSVLGA